MDGKFFVAKSYQKYRQIGKPYKQNGRMYVEMLSPAGVNKTVRAYTEREYLSMYASAAKRKSPIDSKAKTKEDISETEETEGYVAEKYRDDPYFKPDKEKFGFQDGYITVFAGDIISNEDWFINEPDCYYNTFFGWYVPSCKVMPKGIPDYVKPMRLKWELVNDPDRPDMLKYDKREIQKAVRELTFTGFKFPYSLDEKATLTLKLIEIEEETRKYYFKDDKDNLYMWQAFTTILSNSEVGDEIKMRFYVKDKDFYKNQPCTVIARCEVVK